VWVVVIRGPGYREVLEVLRSKGVSFQLVDPLVVDEEDVVKEIRALPPQVRGKVRYGRGRPLPITRSGRLNTGNTAIVLVYRDGKLLDVYPKQLGERYVSPVEGVRGLGEVGPYHPYEESLVGLIRDRPELIGASRVIRTHWELMEDDRVVGEVDLLLEDGSGGRVLVEVEETIGEKAVTQILALAEVLRRRGICPSRLAIVGFAADSKSVRAAKEAGIEVWVLRLERVDRVEG